MNKFVFLLISVGLLQASCTDEKITQNKYVTPKTTNLIVSEQDSNSIRLSDLGEVAYALEKYKVEHRQYPISSKGGEGWDGLYSDYGASRSDWIQGLVPNFLSTLPRDPRNDDLGSHQYLYMSDGANYKLIAHSPSDCEEILNKFPKLVDPERNCWAYGYWTPNAAQW